jgi:hypothetical protein
MCVASEAMYCVQPHFGTLLVDIKFKLSPKCSSSFRWKVFGFVWNSAIRKPYSYKNKIICVLLCLQFVNRPTKPDWYFQAAVMGQRIVRAPQPGTAVSQSPVVPPRRLVLTQSTGHQVTPVPRQVIQQAPKARTVVLRGTNSVTRPVEQQQGIPTRQAVSMHSLAFSVAESSVWWKMKTSVLLSPWVSDFRIFWHSFHCQQTDQFSFSTVCVPLLLCFVVHGWAVLSCITV